MPDKKLFALIGNPVFHSKSPDIFNSIFKKINYNASYSKLACESVEEVLPLFKKFKLSGMNITAPYKEKIIPFLDIIDKEALIIGAVNTVVKINNKLKGYNTDYIGVINTFKQYGINVLKKKCLILGAGGAAKAAVYALKNMGAEIEIINRTYNKAVLIAKKFNCKATHISEIEKSVKNAEIIVSSLSPDVNIINEDWLKLRHIIFDANYKASVLSDLALKKGCKIIKGEDWLINQAIPAFKLFTGINAEKFFVTNHIIK